MSEEKKANSKKRNFKARHRGYSPKLDNEFFELAEQGKFLSEIAYILQIPKETLQAWSLDTKKKASFVKAFNASKEACEAFHERLLHDMVQGRIPKVSAKQIDAQQFILKTRFAEEWAPVEKKELNIHDDSSRLSDDELKLKLANLLSTPQTKHYLRELMANDFKPELEVVDGKKE